MIEIPARRGIATPLSAGRSVRVVNTFGQQVVDTWAFCAGDIREFMSMEHTRIFIGRIIPRVGDALVTNHRRPILTLTEDNSGGIHDTLVAACDRWRYELLGAVGYHDNCTDNLAAALAELGLTPPETPSPLNLFMNIPVIDGNRIDVLPPVSTPGSYVTLRAEMDCIVAFSACPQDMVPINGAAMKPTAAHFEILPRGRGTMPDRLAFAKRLEELKQEHETGLDRLKQLEKQADDLRKTLERISGAIQVLEEILAENNS